MVPRNSAPNSSMSHSSISLISFFNTVPPCTFHILLICEFYSLLLCHTGTSVHLCPPPLSYWYASFLFLAGPGHLNEIAVSAFSRSPLGDANAFSFLALRLIPRISLERFSDFTLFLSASLSLLSIRPSTSALHLPNFSTDITSSWLPPAAFILSRLRYPTLFQLALLLLSSTDLSTTAGNLFFCMFLTFYRHFNFLLSLLVLSGHIHSSALDTALLARGGGGGEGQALRTDQPWTVRTCPTTATLP